MGEIHFSVPSRLVSLAPQGEETAFFSRLLERVVENLGAYKMPYYIPTPVLSEILIYLDERLAAKILAAISFSDIFRIIPFDTKAAVELANMDRDVIVKGDKREGSKEPYQKIKLYRQIVAICKTHNIQTLYSEEKNLCKIAQRHGMIIKDHSN
jgi:predicted nucleic acid-binding protein